MGSLTVGHLADVPEAGPLDWVFLKGWLPTAASTCLISDSPGPAYSASSWICSFEAASTSRCVASAVVSTGVPCGMTSLAAR